MRPAHPASPGAGAALPTELHEARIDVRPKASDSHTYVPPFKLIEEALRIRKEDLDTGGNISIPTPVFKELMAYYVKNGYFDERWYVETNPDVDNAIKNGKITDGLEHFVSAGYYEGRSPGLCYVDREWYEQHYRDVALATRKGRVIDSAEHFHHTGYNEGRAPSADQLSAAEKWSKLLSR